VRQIVDSVENNCYTMMEVTVVLFRN